MALHDNGKMCVTLDVGLLFGQGHDWGFRGHLSLRWSRGSSGGGCCGRRGRGRRRCFSFQNIHL